MTRDIDRLEDLVRILNYSCIEYVALAVMQAPAIDRILLRGHFDLPQVGELEAACFNLDHEDLLVLAMVSADEEHGPILQDLYPELWAEIEDAQQPLRDDSAVDRAYDQLKDQQLGVL